MRKNRPFTLLHALESYLKNSSDMLFVKDTNLVYVAASDSFVKLLNLSSQDDIVGKTDFEIFPKELAEKYVADDKLVINNNEAIIDMVERLPYKDGKPRYSSTSKHAVYDNKDKIIGLYGIGRDITPQIEAEFDASHMHGILNNIPGGVAVYRISDKIRCDYISGDIIGIFGLTAEEYVQKFGQDCIQLVAKEDRAGIEKIITTAFNERTPFTTHFRIDKPDGSNPWIKVVGNYSRMEKGEAVYYCSILDVTETIVAENTARRANEKLLQITENLPGGFVVYKVEDDYRLTLESISKGYSDLVKLSRVKLFSLYLRDPYFNIHPDDIFFTTEIATNGIKSGNDFICTYRLLIEDSYRWIRSIVHQLTDDEGTRRLYAVFIDVTEIKETENELRYRDELSRLLLEESNTVTFDYNVKTKVMETSFIAADGHREHYYIQDYLTQQEGTKVTSTRSREYVTNCIKNATLDPTVKTGEYQASYGGVEQWYFATYRGLVDDTGKVYRVVGKSRNIQKEKDIQQRFETEVARRSTQDNDLLAAASYNLTQNYMLDIDSGENGRSPLDISMTPNIAALTIGEKIPDKAQREVFTNVFSREYLLDLYAGGKYKFSYEYRRDIGNGEVRWVESQADLIERRSDQSVLVFLYTYDIHERKMLDTFVQGILSSEFDFIIQIDTATSSYVSYTKEIGGYGMMPQSGRNFEKDYVQIVNKYIYEDDKSICMTLFPIGEAVKRLNKEGDFALFYRVNTANGGIARKKLHVFYSDKRLGIVCLARTDVTNVYAEEQSKNDLLRAALSAAESANCAKSEFLARMSHEIRTPLNAMIGYLTIAQGDKIDMDKMLDCVVKAGSASKSLLNLLNDILDMSSIESGKMKMLNESFDLKQLISNLSSLYYSNCSAKGVTFISLVKDLTEEYVIGDSMRLNQILMNLLSNAVKFTPTSGKVTLTVTQTTVRNGKVYLRFEVADNGIGIDKEFLDQMWQPFEQESSKTTHRFGGTGLGLSIVKSIVTLMNGEVKVMSEKGLGSTFIVDLPFGEDCEHKSGAPVGYDFSNVRALIVDDDESTCEYIQLLMQRCGVRSDKVNCGADAIQSVKHAYSIGDKYSLCLMDWKMPDMDGLETIRRLRLVVGNDLPIIIVTAYDFTEIEEEAKSAGVTFLVSKPLFQSTLFDLLITAYGKYTTTTPKKITRNFGGCKLLLVEDNDMNREIAKTLLENVGFVVEEVLNGREAVDRFAQSKPYSYDAILMDIQMPVMNGYEATQAIRALPQVDAKKIPIIAMTANAFAEDINTAISTGMDDHISKPIDVEVMYETLAKVLQKSKK